MSGWRVPSASSRRCTISSDNCEPAFQISWPTLAGPILRVSLEEPGIACEAFDLIQLTIAAAALFKDFSNSATSATNDIKSFMKDMQTERVQSMLARAAESRKEGPAGIRPWRVTEHPDWADRDGAPNDEDQQGLAGARHNIDTVMDDNSSSNDTGELKGTLDQFAKEHPDIQTASKEETQTIEVSRRPNPSVMFAHFTDADIPSCTSKYNFRDWSDIWFCGADCVPCHL